MRTGARPSVLCSAFLVLSSAFAVLMSAGCSASRLTNAQPSAEMLARAVVDAVERRDEGALRRLAITEEEFRDHVWPELPASRPERNMPMSYVWGDLRQKSDSGLRSILSEHGGRHYTLVDVRFDGASTDYAAFRVYREAVFVVRNGRHGPSNVRLCGSMVEKDGGWKVFSFVTDD